MVGIEVKERYYEWLIDLIGGTGTWLGKSYRNLLRYLFQTLFCPNFGLDENRAEDGADLRYRFGYENKLSRPDIVRNLDYRPCSMLEMMISMCKKCEESIMFQPEDGDRTGQWFFEMIRSLGLEGMHDARFNPYEVDRVIDRFMDHRYQPNGEGGLYTIRNIRIDMRRLELWDQMNEYLNEMLDERRNV